MSDSLENYANWRRAYDPTGTLHETPAGRPAERLLQAVWSRQRICRDTLRTTDGRALRVLHPGFWNREAGPDFRGAVLAFDDTGPVEGDVEVDLSSDGWRGHGHDRNPAFTNVILHVVWEAASVKPARQPILVLRNYLDAPLAELCHLLEGELPPPLSEDQQGRCSAPLRVLDRAQLGRLLREAARVRLEARASQLCARARQAGWERALTEGLLRGLGYKHNAWPMQRLGELVPRLRPDAEREGRAGTVRHWLALLLGVGGLLPAEVAGDTNAGRQLRGLWDIWWRERDRFNDCILPARVWRLAGIRPANHPQRRLALAAQWLADTSLFKRLEEWFGQVAAAAEADTISGCVSELAGRLRQTLEVPRDAFWSCHWTLRSKPMPQPRPLLGATRVTDLAINVILPWFYVRAREGRSPLWQAAAAQAWFAWPAAQDNAVLRLARARLLGNAGRKSLATAADQQGLLQITRDFCDHSNAICERCRFPALVATLAGGSSGTHL